MTALWFVVIAQQQIVEQGWLLYLNYGVLGATVLLLLIGRVVPGPLHDRLIAGRDETIAQLKEQLADCRKEVEKERAEVNRLNTVIQDKVIPAVVRSTDLAAHLVETRARSLGGSGTGGGGGRDG